MIDPISSNGAGSLVEFQTHPTWIEFDDKALRHNLALVRKRIKSGVMIIASVKANAYGHGIIPVARILEEEGVEMLATGSFRDALAIRSEGIKTPILMLAGTLPSGVSELIRANLIPTIYDLDGAAVANSASIEHGSNDPKPIFVKVDCGMGRVGINLEKAPELIQAINSMPNIWVQGIYTHLSFKDDVGMGFSKERLSLFYELLKSLENKGYDIPVTQALASSALSMDWMDSCTAICPGHLLYGLSSVNASLTRLENFSPVCKAIKSKVIHVAEHGQDPQPGSGGYHKDRTYSRTAVIPFGLNDGNRALNRDKNSAILFKGRRLPILGISLEHLVFEVHDDLFIEVGDEITIVGKDLSEKIELAEYANWQENSPLEALMALSNRLPFKLVNEY